MNIIETLPKAIRHNDILYVLSVYVTAWNNLCVCYKEAFKHEGHDFQEILVSVCVEPDNEPRTIESTIGCFLNEYVGNARTFDDAAQMLKEYVEKNYEVD